MNATQTGSVAGTSSAATPGSVSRGDPSATAWISWLRILAIAGVVAIHTTGATATLPHARTTASGIVAVVVNRGFNFAVPLFVMLSGALILDPSRYPGDLAFLRKRAFRLLPALVFWHLFYWAFRVVALHQTVTPHDALVQTLNGRLYTALYFFWIVLGLAVVSPVLIAWLRGASRRAAVVAGCLGASIAILTSATVRLRGAPVAWIETPWTWWIPYVGVFLLGWALRGVRLHWWGTVVCLAGPVVILGSVAYTYRRQGVPGWYGQLFGGYYSLGIQLAAVLAFLAGQEVLRADGPFRALTAGRTGRLARTLGDATLGIFVTHLAVLEASYHLPLVGGDAPAQSVHELVGRVVFVVIVSTALTLGLRRIPYVRRLV